MKSPPRFAISDDTGSRKGDTIRVTGSELHHMRDVMRLSPGTEVVLCNANGREYAGHIAGFERNVAIITVAAELHQQTTGSPDLILAAGMIKAARMDLLIEKAAELDAAEFWPLLCARSVVRGPSSARRERWRRISVAAAKQSQRSHAMEVHEPVEVDAMARRVANPAFAVMCMAGAQPLSAMIRRMGKRLKDCPAVVLAVGPEGDFTPEETASMRQAGFVAAGLGSNRLRSETAALAALSIATGVLGELEDAQRRFE
ncbi:MAG: 16S rRNA (uracil(1498)-N(3))-methyltransferase [Deltaproteobacteria bacterium]|nr:16S rRNA (uracil(1498)-N(3))-methyltransferase [Deltaproteobacteria bacterium]